MSDWLVPVKEGADPYEDPFTKAKLVKQQNVIKNKIAQVKNIDRAEGKGKRKEKATASDSLFSIPEMSDSKFKDKKKVGSKVVYGKGKTGTTKVLQDVSVSTASMGRFDQVVKGEGERTKVSSKRRRYDDNIGSITKEKSRDLSILASMIGGEEGSKLRKAATSSGEGERPSKRKRV
jgi:hypothetical protein